MQRHWAKGQHGYVIGRTTMFDTKEFDAWIRNPQQVSDFAETNYKSEFSRTAKKFTKKLSRPKICLRLSCRDLERLGEVATLKS